MTRRRFQHCRNEKCNRRLEERLDRPDEPPPAARLCEACLELEARTEASSYQRGYEDGTRSGMGLATLRAAVVAGVLALAGVVAWLAGVMRVVVQF